MYCTTTETTQVGTRDKIRGTSFVVVLPGRLLYKMVRTSLNIIPTPPCKIRGRGCQFWSSGNDASRSQDKKAEAKTARPSVLKCSPRCPQSMKTGESRPCRSPGTGLPARSRCVRIDPQTATYVSNDGNRSGQFVLHNYGGLATYQCCCRMLLLL